MPDEPWTIKRALDWTCGYLERKGDENPRASAQWLLGEAAGLSRIELYTNFDRVLSATELDALHGFVARRAAGEPLQYITGEVTFRHINVHVKRGVLIPRPETEVLVSEALALLPPVHRRYFDDDIVAALATSADAAIELIDSDDSSEAFRDLFAQAKETAESGVAGAATDKLLVADICTGSGCIACSIAYEHPETLVVATDIAPEAIELARENVRALGLDARIGVVASDLGNNVAARFMGKFDLVVSNPPYVPSAVLAELPREVADFEPALALDGGEDGLDLFRRLADWSTRALAPGGGFACELHETCLDAAADYLRGLGFADVKVVADLAGRPRVVVARTVKEGDEHVR